MPSRFCRRGNMQQRKGSNRIVPSRAVPAAAGVLICSHIMARGQMNYHEADNVKISLIPLVGRLLSRRWPPNKSCARCYGEVGVTIFASENASFFQCRTILESLASLARWRGKSAAVVAGRAQGSICKPSSVLLEKQVP